MKCLMMFAMVAALSASAAEPALQTELEGIAFLVGRWQDGAGRIAEGEGTATGNSVISVEAGGGALLRRDHTELFDKGGKPSGGFDQIMLIYPEGGKLHADYTDGTHVIHYGSATVVPGKSVTFLSSGAAGVPTFQLEYAVKSANELQVTFSAAAAGTTDFRAVAVGSLKKR